MEKLHSFMTLKMFRELTADMADDALILARGTNSINLDMVDIVNPTIEPQKRTRGVAIHQSIEKVYGGNEFELMNESKQAIVLCEMD